MTAPVPTLGAVPGRDGTTFAVFSRGDAVDLCLVGEDGGETRVPLTGRVHDVWHEHVPGVRPGQRYGFRVLGPWDPTHGHRYDPRSLLVDPYARAVDGDHRLDDPAAGPWSVVVDDRFDWGDDRAPEVPWADTVLYEMHVRGFTRDHPEVPEDLRGTYAGLAHPAAIGHLVDLGVTTVELMPVHHFLTEPALQRRGLRNYWGYNTLGFFAPHGGYSASGTRGQQVGEFKAMVRALHAAGLEVVLDVVYNHTAEGGADGPTLCWRGLDNAGYYRLRPDGSYDDVTGCGNSLDTRQPRCLQMVTDSLRYWAQEMHVDGFRFDLAPTLARGTAGFDAAAAFLAVVAQDPVISRAKLVAEPWDVGPAGYQLGSFPPPWAEWNDRFRDTVRATWLAPQHRQHGGGVRDLAYRLSGSSDVFEASRRGPLASVNLVTAHDGYTLHDVVTYERKRNHANGEDGMDGAEHNRSWNCGREGPTDDPDVLVLRRRMMRNLLATLLLSTGVPMLTSGDETGRTQRGNNNAYCHDDELTWLSWHHQPWQQDLLLWTRALLELRRENPVLRHAAYFDGQPTPTRGGVKDLAWFGADGREMTPERWFDHDQRVLGMYLSGRPGGRDEHVSSLLVLLNTGPEEAEVVLPGPPWAASYDTLLDTVDERPKAGPGVPAETALQLGARSLRLLAARR
jgi:glycogen operon protein